VQVYAADGTPLRGDLITRVVLRTDLTPIPSTVEISATRTRETSAAIVSGKIVLVGAEQTAYELVRVDGDKTSGVEQGGREIGPITAYGILASCAALGRRLQRSIIRRGSTFADIYRSIGATAVIDSDFAVPSFAAFVGMLPTPEIAKVLQEEAAVIFYEGGKIRFRRLTELASVKADIEFPVDRTEEISSAFLERQAIPFVMSTAPSGAIITSGKEAARGLVYRPRADQRILTNMGTVLVQRRKMREGLSPDLNAGRRIDIGGKPHIVITAAHVRALANDDGKGEEFTQLWLGEVVR
jgi:hypothetical protein